MNTNSNLIVTLCLNYLNYLRMSKYRHGIPLKKKKPIQEISRGFGKPGIGVKLIQLIVNKIVITVIIRFKLYSLPNQWRLFCKCRFDTV